MNPDHPAPSVCNIGYQITSADERPDNTYFERQENI